MYLSQNIPIETVCKQIGHRFTQKSLIKNIDEDTKMLVSKIKNKYQLIDRKKVKQINALYQIHQRDYKKLFHLIQFYSELSTYNLMDRIANRNICCTSLSNISYATFLSFKSILYICV